MSEKENKKVEKKPKSKARKIAEWVITIVFGLIFVVFAIGQVDGMIHSKEHYGQTLRFGLATFVVQTDSMKDEYPVGTAIMTYHEDVEKVYKRFTSGETIDVTFFDAPMAKFTPTDPTYTDQTNASSPTQVPMTHRVREMHIDTTKKVGEGKYIFVVSGTNISEHQAQAGQYQAFTEKEYLGVVVGDNQVVGAIFNFMTTPWGYIIIILIPTFYLVITSVLDIFKAFKETDDEEATANGAPAAAAASGDISGLSAKDKERLKQELLQEMLEKKQQQKEAKSDD